MVILKRLHTEKRAQIEANIVSPTANPTCASTDAVHDYCNILKSLAPIFKAATIYPGYDAAPEQIAAAVHKMSQVSVGLVDYIAKHGDELELDAGWARKKFQDFTAELVATHWITTVIGKGGAVPGHSPDISVKYFIPAINVAMELPSKLSLSGEKVNLSITGEVQLSLLKAMTPIVVEVEKFVTIINAHIPEMQIIADDLVMEIGRFIMEEVLIHHEKFTANNPEVTNDDRRVTLQALITHTSSVLLSAWEYCRGEVLGAVKDATTPEQVVEILRQPGFMHGFPLEILKARAKESLRRLTQTTQYALTRLQQTVGSVST